MGVAQTWLITYLSIFLASLVFNHSGKVDQSAEGCHGSCPTKKSGMMVLSNRDSHCSSFRSCWSLLTFIKKLATLVTLIHRGRKVETTKAKFDHIKEASWRQARPLRISQP